MTGKRGKSGGSDKVVHARLASGEIREYRYPRTPAKPVDEPAARDGIKQLAQLYKASPEFKALSERWQSARRYYLAILENELGFLSLADLQKRAARTEFYELRDQLADTPAKADRVMDTLRTLLTWAYDRGRIEVNHGQGIKRLSSSSKVRNENIWTEGHEAIVYAGFPPSLVQAFRFALFSCARQSDMCALRWKENYRDGWITFQPAKTKAKTRVWVHLPVFALDPFRELVDGLSRGTEYMLTTETGQPLDAINLRARWRYAMAKTDLAGEDLHWHDLRGTGITRMQEAGCTDAEVGSISGHALGMSTAASDYTARTRALALHAYQKLNRYLKERPTVVPLTNGPGKRGK